MVNGETVIENWTHHGPTGDAGEFLVGGDGESVAETVEIVVEHFEIFGFAVLEVSLERVPD